VAWAEAYLPTKWHLDPSNRLATYTNVTDRQTGQTTIRQHRANRFTNGRPKNAAGMNINKTLAYGAGYRRPASLWSIIACLYMPDRYAVLTASNAMLAIRTRLGCHSRLTLLVGCSGWEYWAAVAYPRGIKRFMRPKSAKIGLNNWCRICR